MDSPIPMPRQYCVDSVQLKAKHMELGGTGVGGIWKELKDWE